MEIFGQQILHGIQTKPFGCQKLMLLGMVLLFLNLSACHLSDQGYIANSGSFHFSSDNATSDWQCFEKQTSTTPENYEEPRIKDISPQDLMLSIQINSYLLAVAHPIELAYIEETGQASGTTAEASQIYEKYQTLWEEEIDKYQVLIETEFENIPELLICFQESMDDWRSSTEHDVALYIELEKCLHKDGTITTSNVLRFTMEQYRAKALQLISIYDEIMVGRGWSWKNQLLKDMGE